jgi:hypothetical protein
MHYSFPLSTRHPPNITSNPRSARIRIWWKDIRTHKRQVATIKALTYAVEKQVAEMKYTTALFNNAARLHGLVIGPQVNLRKRPYSPDATPHRETVQISNCLSARLKRRKRHKY